MKYGLQPATEGTGARPLQQIKGGFAASEYSRCCLPLDTTQAPGSVSDTASPSHRRSRFLFDFYLTWLRARAGEGTAGGEGKKKGQMLPCKQVQEPVCTTHY